MSDATKISWTDSTFNPWIGCTKVSPGCDSCYAEAMMDKRYGKVSWGAGQRRVRTAAENWKKPVRWNARDFYECSTCSWRGDTVEMDGPSGKAGGGCPHCAPARGMVRLARRRVFCASLADVFDNAVDPAWRADLFTLIEETPNLDWLLLTKRIGNVPRLMENVLHRLHWPASASFATMLPNVWLGATVVNQAEADRDIPKLLAEPARVRFLSIEPMLGPINLERIKHPYGIAPSDTFDCTAPWGARTQIDWVIVGGESGSAARAVHPDWVRSLRDQCVAARLPMHFKQWGEWAPKDAAFGDRGIYPGGPTANLPPDNILTIRCGTKRAGRQLDGREWNDFPATEASHA